MLINCKKIKDELLEQIQKDVESLPFSPVFCDILVGDDEVSARYVRIKARTAESVGIKFRTATFPNTITTEELIAEVEQLNSVPHMCGIIVQLPLPAHIDKQRVLDAIKPTLDVDCLGASASNAFYLNEGHISYPTALACISILDSLMLDLSTKNIVVLGQGSLVGRPVAHILRSRGLNITTIDSKTVSPELILKDADVIVSAIGKGKYITKDMVKDNCVIIDAGTSEEDGGVVGDVDTVLFTDGISLVTPSPGGVGPITVAFLLSNVIDSAKVIYE
jgi:methylenetetrahydrofolate dehydrogenase (NADP+) / methenyltetrahydrofolate cyclohydrolase